MVRGEGLKELTFFTIGRRLKLVIRKLLLSVLHQLKLRQGATEVQMITKGWDLYAKTWRPNVVPKRASANQRPYLGDEWTAGEDAKSREQPYGLPWEVSGNFDDYLQQNLLDRYLLPRSADGLEIGPGGGRLTRLLLPRTEVLHVAEPSETMLRHLKERFAEVSNVRYHQTDGITLPALNAATLDFVFSFDVFVHLEPRLIYWYLRQIEALLKPGGTGIIHYSNIVTRLGWRRFESELEENLQQRSYFGAFGVMCPQLMVTFLEALQLEVISADVSTIPRDSIAVFRKRAGDETG